MTLSNAQGSAPEEAQVQTPAEAAGANPSMDGQRQKLLSMRVSSIIDAHPHALQALIDGGFGPLANPVARLAMAHTVNLGQAFRIRGQDDADQEALIGQLLRLAVDRSTK